MQLTCRWFTSIWLLVTGARRAATMGHQRTLPTQDFSHFQRHLVARNSSIQRNSLPQQLLPYLPTSPKWPLWPRQPQLPVTTHCGLATGKFIQEPNYFKNIWIFLPKQMCRFCNLRTKNTTKKEWVFCQLFCSSHEKNRREFWVVWNICSFNFEKISFL